MNMRQGHLKVTPFLWGIALILLQLVPVASQQGGTLPLTSNTAAKISSQHPHAPSGHWEQPITVTGSVEVQGQPNRLYGTGRLLVYLPANYQSAISLPLVLALHGWNQSPEQWRDKSVIAELADRYDVLVACPDMGRTVYETRFFPETRNPWNTVPGTPWLLQVIVPYVLHHYRVRANPRYQAIIGYSTGGRGAVMAIEHGGHFGFCASLSGTYDLMLLDPKTGEYRIHAMVYGPRERFSARWKGEGSVNPGQAGSFADTMIYIAHGAKDPVVNPNQAEAMGEFLRVHQLVYQVNITPRGRHDWIFWNSQLPHVFSLMNDRFHQGACEHCHDAIGSKGKIKCSSSLPSFPNLRNLLGRALPPAPAANYPDPSPDGVRRGFMNRLYSHGNEEVTKRSWE